MDDVRVSENHGVGYALEDLTVGMTAAYEHVVTDADVVKFADISGDHNPVHLDEAFTRNFVRNTCCELMTWSIRSARLTISTLPCSQWERKANSTYLRTFLR